MKIGVDLGGSKILSILADYSDGSKKIRVLKQFQCETEADKGETKVVENIVKAIKAVMPEHESPEMIGIASAGNPYNGRMYGMNNFNIRDGFALEAKLKKFFPNITIKMDNDVNCFALAEHLHFQKPNLIGITLGTGVGGGIIINHKLYGGTRNSAGEFGHMVIVADGEKCTCERKGCFEEYCSARALERYYLKLAGGKKPAAEITLGKNANSKKAIAEFGKYLGIALANIANIFDPDIIVIGGGLSNIRGLMQYARDGVKDAKFLGRKVRIEKSFFGSISPAIGAIML